jgi:hypothetical protein
MYNETGLYYNCIEFAYISYFVFCISDIPLMGLRKTR